MTLLGMADSSKLTPAAPGRGMARREETAQGERGWFWHYTVHDSLPCHAVHLRCIALLDDPGLVHHILEHLGHVAPEPAERDPRALRWRCAGPDPDRVRQPALQIRRFHGQNPRVQDLSVIRSGAKVLPSAKDVKRAGSIFLSFTRAIAAS
ncbi:MAG: hypothetical protein OEP48_04820 [Betaproteobacteria bacterium]|nr:hypothetical protein [Betaproteobacteria bacterium]MDH3438719.1 hypothetical protein [Betaproteobacteria bacterium]